jgi:hypothetical protein
MWWCGNHHILIEDRKSLKGEVQSAEENAQLRDYAALAYESHTLGVHLELKSVTVFINQPLVSMNPPLVRYDSDDLKRAHAEMLARVAASHTENPNATPGAVQCKYCRARNHPERCPEYEEWVLKAMPLDVLVPIGKFLPIATLWTRDDWGTCLDYAERVETWFKEKKAKAKEMLKADADAIPGWKLSRPKSTPTITDTLQAWQGVASVISQEAMLRSCKVLIGKLAVEYQTGLKFKGEEASKVNARKKLEAALGKALVKEEGEPSIVRARE